MNARARKIEAELIHFFAEVVGVNVAWRDGIAYIAVIPTLSVSKGVVAAVDYEANAELIELTELAERIERI